MKAVFTDDELRGAVGEALDDAEKLTVDAGQAPDAAALRRRGWIVSGDADAALEHVRAERPDLHEHELLELVGYKIVAVGRRMWVARRSQ